MRSVMVPGHVISRSRLDIRTASGFASATIGSSTSSTIFATKSRSARSATEKMFIVRSNLLIKWTMVFGGKKCQA